MVISLALGAVVISAAMSFLFKWFYTVTYSVIFGIFLVMIPNMLTESCVLGFNGTSALSIFVMILGFLLSFYLGDIKRNNERIKALVARSKNRG